MINCPHIFAGTTRWRSTDDAKSRSIRKADRRGGSRRKAGPTRNGSWGYHGRRQPGCPGNTKPTATGEHHRHGRRQPPGHGQRPATTLPLQPQGETRGDLGQPQETNRHFATGEARKLFLAPRRHDFGRVVAPHPHNPQLDSTTYYAIGRFFYFPDLYP
jgi:hypothetical protein